MANSKSILKNPFLIFIIIISIFIIISVSLYFAYTPTQQKTESFETSWNDIDVIYYINLDFRKDRNDEFLEEIQKMNIPLSKIVRIDAVHNKSNGAIGCSMSHIKTIEEFVKSGHNNCIVFEDDFQFSQDETTTKNTIQQLFNEKIDFDICMLSANMNIDEKNDKTKYDFLYKVSNAQTASGYMVSKSFAPILLSNFKDGCRLLQETSSSEQYAVDQYWKKLQPSSKWYVFNPKLGIQRKSYSDIQNGIVEYGV